MNKIKFFSAIGLFGLFAIANVEAAQVKVTITNNASAGGVALTPVWVGFHNGSFDSYDSGVAASSQLESLAEDGNSSALSATFSADGTLVATAKAALGNRVQGSIGSAPITAGSSVSAIFDLSGGMSNQYFSYASMVLPSNDYFIANENPLAHNLADLFSNGGSFSFNIGVNGSINDAGTEINDFTTSAGNGLFAGLPPMQGGPNMGADENGVVHNVSNPYADFLNIPANFDLAAFDFNSSTLYPNGLATVTISAVPLPATFWFMTSGLVGLVSFSRKKYQLKAEV